MKHLFPIIALLVLLAAILWAQPAPEPSRAATFDSLIQNAEFETIHVIIDTHPDAKARAEQWVLFGEKVVEQAEKHFDAGEHEQAAQLLDKAIGTLTKTGRADSLPTASLWTWKAITCRNLERYTDALEAYNEATRIYERHGYNSPSVAYCYKNAAQIYMRQHNYRRAEECLQAAIRGDSSQYYLLSIYGQLANNAYWQDSIDLALRYVEQGKSIKGNAFALASLRSVGADAWRKKGQWRQAEAMMRQALAFYQNEPGEEDNTMRSLTSLAHIAANTGRPREAEALFQQAERIGLAYFKGKSREMAKLYCEWGDFLSSLRREGEALQCYQKALVQAYPTFHDRSPALNPSPAEPPLELWAMNAPARKAALLLRNPTPQHRATAADCFDLAFAVAERLRRTYSSDEAKLYFTQHNSDIRREAARNLWAMYRASSDEAHLQRLFDLLEKGRASTLRDALLQQRALALTGIPDSLLHIEEALRLGRADLQMLVSEAEAKNDTALVTLRSASLFQLERRYEELFAFLKKNYPQFDAFHQADAPPRLVELSAALPDSAALLAWFDASDRYLCLTLRRGRLSGYEVPRDSALEATLVRFLRLLPDKGRQEAAPTDLFSDAFQLCQRLLPDSAIAGVRSLVVIPDGPLCYLPFEALLTAPHMGGYASAPYLLCSTSVQYAWSATLLTLPAFKKNGVKGLLHIAPFVHTARDGLAPLPNSLRDAPASLVATVLEGEKATANSFLQRAPDHNILHLSTHADAGGRAVAGIEFYDRRLTLSEIYAQRLRASLVSLSACETGSGRFAEGEGVMSLARAFAYAGAQSLVASHWAVNERSTAAFFSKFYQHLEKGRSKAEALRLAKLDYLASSEMDARKAPFHWAAFTLTGADGPVELEGAKWPWWAWALLVAGGLVFLGWWVRGRLTYFQ